MFSYDDEIMICVGVLWIG